MRGVSACIIGYRQPPVNIRMIPLKVLYICEPPMSGVPIYVEQIVRRLHGNGFHISVLCTAGSMLNTTLAGTGIQLLEIDLRPFTPFNALKASLQLTALLRRRSFDLVHMHSSKAGLIGRPVCALFGIAAVFTPHCFSFESVRRSRVRAALYLSCEKLLGRCTSHIACVSESEAASARQHHIVPDECISAIPCFVDAERWKPRPPNPKIRADLGFPPGAPVLGTISRFHAQKAPLDFVNMAAALLRHRPDARFLFIGEDGPLRPAVEERIRTLGLLEKIVIHPWTSDLPAFVALMDVVVLNSLWEGLPLSIIEAMAMAKPIVATSLAGTRELLGDNDCGVLVPPAQPAAMADAVHNLLNAPERMRNLGERGRAKALVRHSLDQAVDRTARLYKQLATAHPGVHRSPQSDPHALEF